MQSAVSYKFRDLFFGILVTGLFVFLSAFFALSAVASDILPAERQVELENLLEQDCGSCHGLLLNGGLGPSLQLDALKGKNAEFLKITIRDGRPNTAMPPWGPLLSEADIDWLANRLLQKPSAQLPSKQSPKPTSEQEGK